MNPPDNTKELDDGQVMKCYKCSKPARLWGEAYYCQNPKCERNNYIVGSIAFVQEEL